jgi:hypothetical protein
VERIGGELEEGKATRNERDVPAYVRVVVGTGAGAEKGRALAESPVFTSTALNFR